MALNKVKIDQMRLLPIVVNHKLFYIIYPGFLAKERCFESGK